MARTRNVKRRVPTKKTGARVLLKKQCNIVHSCNEDRTLFAQDLDLGAILSNDDDDDDNSGHDHLPEPAPHSKEVSPCSNAVAHQDQDGDGDGGPGSHLPHYVCTNCSSLANVYLRKDPYGLLHSGHPFVKGQRFFPLCKGCVHDTVVQTQSTTTTTTCKQQQQQAGCSCGDCLEGESLCFKCKRAKLYLATAKRDAEVERVRLGFAPWEEEEEEDPFGTNNNNNKSQSPPSSLFMRPILRCICGEEDLDLLNGDGGGMEEGILRCAGCEGLVTKTAGQVWDPLAREFIKIGKYKKNPLTEGEIR